MDEKMKEALETIREKLMDEVDKASTERDFDRVAQVSQGGISALSVLENVLGGRG